MRFLCAVCYDVEAACATPLRTGGPDGDPEMILTGGDGLPFLQGSSLAGAFRSWLTEAKGADAAAVLFGSPNAPSHLIVSDGCFHPGVKINTRPRLRINGATGAADPQGKFDLAQVNANACFTFRLTWLGNDLQGQTNEIAWVEGMLAALNAGDIRLGGQKSQGFGRVSLVVKKQSYDMKEPADREAWLEDRFSGLTLSLQPVQAGSGRVTFLLTGRTDSLLVRSGAPAAHSDKNGGSYTENMTEGDIPVLPGSSVKGAVRARAALIVNSTEKNPSLVEKLFGRGAGEEDNGLPGRVFFQDMLLDRNKKRQISRIRIDRFTGGVIRGGLFREEPLASPVRLSISAPADDPAGCALLLYALRDLGMGLYSLGSGGSIGRGFLHGEALEIIQNGEKKAVLTFGDSGCTLSDPEGITQSWMDAWKEAVQ